MPGEVKTEVFDIDLRMRGGKTMPVRLYHKLAFGADGVPGASRTLVISRARDERADPQRAAEVRFMRFFDHTPMAIATVDRGGAVVRANARFAKLAQSLSPDGAASKSIFRAVNARDRAPADRGHQPGRGGAGRYPAGRGDARRAAGALGAVLRHRGRGRRARDRGRHRLSCWRPPSGATLENQINQSQKMDMVGQLAGGIAHDFNNVLSAIMMANDFLLNAHKPTDPSFQDIMQIKQNATRAATLVRQLLAFSRRQTLRPQVLDLGDALSDLTMLLRRLIGEKVKLDLVHGRDLWPVKVDVSQFEQVIVNLAVNARDAMPEGGKLTVRTANLTAEEAGAARLQGHAGGGLCADRHHPIPAPAFPPISSTRSSSRSSRPRKSARAPGSACRRCTASSSRPAASSMSIPKPARAPRSISSCRGTIPNWKTQIDPALANGAARERRRRRPSRATDLTGQGTILLVEDEEGLRSLNARGLRSRGYSVIEASNGIEAMEALEEKNGAVDLVVSDVVMPEMDGPTLLKTMRGRNPDLKIIFVSGYAEDAFEKSLPENQQFAFLPKPFTLSQLVAAVKETMTPS